MKFFSNFKLQFVSEWFGRDCDCQRQTNRIDNPSYDWQKRYEGRVVTTSDGTYCECFSSVDRLVNSLLNFLWIPISVHIYFTRFLSIFQVVLSRDPTVVVWAIWICIATKRHNPKPKNGCFNKKERFLWKCPYFSCIDNIIYKYLRFTRQ